MNNSIIFARSISAVDDIDVVLQTASQKIIEVAEPYIFAKFLINSGYIDKGAELASNILKNTIGDSVGITWSYSLIAARMADLEKLNEAVELMKQATQLYKSDAYSHSNYGFLLAQIGDRENAVYELEQAIKLKKDAHIYNNYYNNYAIVLDRIGRNSDADEAFRAAIQLAPRDPETLLNVAFSRLQHGDAKEAKLYFEMAVSEYHNTIEQSHRLAGAHFQLATALKMLSKWPESIDEYREAIKIDFRPPSYHRALAEALRQQGRISEAEEELRTAKMLSPPPQMPHLNDAGLKSESLKSDAGFRTVEGLNK